MTKEEAIRILASSCIPGSKQTEALETLIPELRESEDEMIRKDIINLIYWLKGNPSLCSQYYKDRYDSILAYLEKQGEQKVSVDDFKAKDWYVSKVDGKIHNIYYSVDKVKPKFKVGDKIIEKNFDKCGRGTIIDIKDGKYIFDDGGFICIEEQGLWKLVEQKPAEYIKRNSKEWYSLLAEQYDKGFWKGKAEQKPITESKRLANEVIEYLIKCGYSPVLKDDSKKEHFHIDIPRHEDDFWLSEEYKHCCSILGEYYMEGDYGGDTYTLYIWREKKEQVDYEAELKKCKDNPLYFFDKYVSIKLKPMKWNEEDEEMLQSIIKDFRAGKVSTIGQEQWLKSLPERFNLQPKQEWSEEDEKKIIFLERLIEHNVPDGQYGWVDGMKGGFVTKSEAISMLKSLSPQYHGDVTMTEAFKMGLEAGKASSWQPSEEDLMMLEHIIGQYEIGNKNSKVMGYLPRIEELDFLKKVLAKWKN